MSANDNTVLVAATASAAANDNNNNCNNINNNNNINNSVNNNNNNNFLSVLSNVRRASETNVPCAKRSSDPRSTARRCSTSLTSCLHGQLNLGYLASRSDLIRGSSAAISEIRNSEDDEDPTATEDPGSDPANNQKPSNDIRLIEFRKLSDKNAENSCDPDSLHQHANNRTIGIAVVTPSRRRSSQAARELTPSTFALSDAQLSADYPCESWWQVLRQMLLPFMIAGFGSVFAGIVLNAVTQWPVFAALPQLEIMVPAFLGLIGNIETTVASRLSTAANLGDLDRRPQLESILCGNFWLVQCQSPILGLFAAACSFAISALRPKTRQTLSLDHALLIAASSTVTSVASNTLLSTLISAVIISSRKLNLNPDNISIPVAASMGDVCSITILAFVAQNLFQSNDRNLLISIIVVSLVAAPIFGYFARQNRYSRSVIITGWSAIMGAVIVEQPGGIVMQSAFEQYKVLSTFQPLVNGIGSNLVGIQTSRMSTFLHSVSKKGQLPESNPRACVGPFWVFFSRDRHARMARLLMAVVIPSHLFYMTFIYLVQNEFAFSLAITPAFIATYCVAVAAQLAILLYLAYVSVFWAWRRKINPDNSAIPFTSALADVLGNCLMAAAFLYLQSIDDPNTKIYTTESINSTTTIPTITTTATPNLVSTLSSNFDNISLS